jgi:hypothetical protein
MKILIYLSIFLKVSSATKSECENLSLLACAFVNITKSLAKNGRQISIYKQEKNHEKNMRAHEKALDLVVPKESYLSYDIKDLKDEKYIKTIHGQDFITSKFKINESGIMMFESIQALAHFNAHSIFTNKGPKLFRFYIYCPKLTSTQIMRHLNDSENLHFTQSGGFVRAKNDIVHFQYYLVDERKVIKLYTLVWFSPRMCHQQKLLEVNRFNKRTRKWAHAMFYTKKFDNFFGCELNLVESAYGQDITKDTYDVFKMSKGFDYDILWELRKRLNFKPKIIKEMKHLTNYSVPFDLYMASDCYPRTRYPISQPYLSATEYLAVPIGEEYNGYEKLVTCGP